MSNYQAVATVTAALQEILQEAVNAVVGGAAVTIKRPDARDDASADQPGVNIFLYRSSINPAHRNRDLPTRGSNGRLQNRPQVGLNLDYLFTFYGSGFQPQLLLGQTVAALHAEPILTSRRVIEAIENHRSGDRGNDLSGSDLAETLERISISLISLDLEALSKLWSVFLHVPYDLSIAYQVSAVLIDSDVPVSDPLPVQAVELSTDIAVATASSPPVAPRPRLTKVTSRKAGGTTTVTVQMETPVHPEQDVVLLFNELGAESSGGVQVALRADQSRTKLSVSVPELKPKTTYLVRVRIDGVDSELEYDASLRRYFGPHIGPPPEVPSP